MGLLSSISSASNGLKKLTITPLRKNVTTQDASYSLDRANEVACQFNPESLRVSKNVRWTFKADFKDNVPQAFFSGGGEGSFELQLLFDTTDTGGDVQTKYINLYEFARADPAQNKQPHQVLIQWGKNIIGDVWIIENISQEFTMFKPDGTPLRANVHVCFKQVHDSKKKSGQNPTSRTEARRTWIVEQGQRLDWIAYQEYGDSSAWRHIAETNGIVDPLAIRPGQILKLVSIE